MRVLANVMVVATSVVGMACYSPAVDDCQFRCGSNEPPCPVGTTCVAGSCRTDQRGSCPSSTTDSGSTVDSSTDGMADPCPGVPASPSGCSLRFAIAGGGCGVVCTETARIRSGAKAACNGGWRLAVLDSALKLDMVPITAGTYWVGALRTSGVWRWEDSGNIVTNECWLSGTQPIGGNDCAVVDGNGKRLVNSVACSVMQSYICTYP